MLEKGQFYFECFYCGNLIDNKNILSMHLNESSNLFLFVSLLSDVADATLAGWLSFVSKSIIQLKSKTIIIAHSIWSDSS